jgi:fatty-acyl-CoA synthase
VTLSAPKAEFVRANREALEERWGGAWVPRTTAQLLDHVAAVHPDRPYVVTDERVYTYREMATWSTRLAAGLASLGVGPGSHVAVDMANYPEVVALKFAVARLGALSVSINFLLRQEELGYVLRQSRSKVLITMDHFRDLDYLAALDGLAPGWETNAGGSGLPDLEQVFVFGTSGAASRGRSLDTLIDLGASITDAEIAERTAAVPADADSDLLYTSGTTGKAKGVLLQHDAVLRMGYGSAYCRAFDDGYRIMFAMPIYHVFGYVEGTIAAMFAAGSICPQPIFDPARMLERVSEHDVREIMCVPTMTAALLEEAKRNKYDVSALRTMFSSGAAHAPSMWSDMYEVLEVDFIFTAYGQTETTASTTCTQPGDSLQRLLATNGCLKRSGIAGFADLDGGLAVYRVVDVETGRQLPAGEIGALEVHGPVMTRGYFDKPAETAALFTDDGWMRTGDLGRIDTDGYLTLTGRTKESYRCGGELVIPGDVEEVLVRYPGVWSAHVVGVPHDRMGEVGCAWIVPEPGAELDAGELIAFCRDHLARFKVPAHVFFATADEVPLTVTGRVQRFQLVDRALSLLQSSPASVS